MTRRAKFSSELRHAAEFFDTSFPNAVKVIRKGTARRGDVEPPTGRGLPVGDVMVHFSWPGLQYPASLPGDCPGGSGRADLPQQSLDPRKGVEFHTQRSG